MGKALRLWVFILPSNFCCGYGRMGAQGDLVKDPVLSREFAAEDSSGVQSYAADGPYFLMR